MCHKIRDGKLDEVKQLLERMPRPHPTSDEQCVSREDSMSSIETEEDDEEEEVRDMLLGITGYWL